MSKQEIESPSGATLFHRLKRPRSPSTPYFVVAFVLTLLAVASQFRLLAPGRANDGLPISGIEAIAKLPERDDLNVVLIVVDTLRSDHLGAHGYSRSTSPRIDALAARGLRFVDVEAQSSWTKTSMASMWTGMLPERVGVTRFEDRLASDLEMPAERLRRDGYRTIGLWRNGWVAPLFGFDQGFDLYHRPVPGRQDVLRRHQDPVGSRLEGTDSDLTSSAIEFVRRSRSEKFFLYLHYMDVHQYVSSTDSPSYGTSPGDLYDSAIHWTDHNVGRLVDALAEAKMLDRTLIVVAADHGEALGEGGRAGHARSLHPETQRTPLILAFPFALETPIVVDEPVTNMDLWPTLYAMLGLEPGEDLDGLNLVPLILGESRGDSDRLAKLRRRDLVAQLDRSWGQADATSRELASLRRGGLRLLWDRSAPSGFQLFDCEAADRACRDVSDRSPDTAQEMRERLAAILEAAGAETRRASSRVEIDERMLHRLRALGYALPTRDSRGESAETPTRP